MSVETNLRSAMAEAVAPTRPDTERLVATARRRGLGIRRRRQAWGAVGAVAAVAVAVAVPTVVAGDHSPHTPAPVLVGTQPKTLDATRTAPFTGRSTVAALVYAAGLETPGAASHFRGQDGAGDRPETYGVFRFTPAGSATAGEVGVNVQPDFGSADGAKSGDPGGGSVRTQVSTCGQWMQHCTATTLADGSRLVTYEELSSYTSTTGIRRVASLLRADGLRVVASASNGYDVTERDEQITRPEPVLTIAQLTAIVRQPWWGPELPEKFTAEGAALSPYDDLGGAIDGTAVAPSGKP